MDLERERGITIKAHTVRLLYQARDGHDVHAEPHRHAGARRLLVRGVPEPRRVRGRHPDRRRRAGGRGADPRELLPGLRRRTSTIVPVLNKIDLPQADVEGTTQQIIDLLGLGPDEPIAISAKSGTGVAEVLEAIVHRIPPPVGDPEAPLKALVFDSFYDSYQGVVIYVRVIDGRVVPGMKILLMSNGKVFEVQQVGVFSPADACRWTSSPPARSASSPRRSSGSPTRSIGRDDHRRGEPHRRAAPRVIATRSPWSSRGSIPSRTPTTKALRDALEKLRLNDSAFNFEPEIVPRAGLRLPLRVPRDAPPGDRPGAARAGVRPLADRHRPVGPLPHRRRPGGDDRDRQPLEAAAGGRDRAR